MWYFIDDSYVKHNDPWMEMDLRYCATIEIIPDIQKAVQLLHIGFHIHISECVCHVLRKIYR